MRESFGAAGFYNSEFLSDEKNPRDPEILIPAAGFCNSECLSDERITSPQHDFTIPEFLSDEKLPSGPLGFSSPQRDFTIQSAWVMRKSPGPLENLIAAAGFYNSRGLGDEKNPRDPENLIVVAGFYISKCLSDEKIPPGARRFSSS